jgi:dihydrofolate synthase/folylpolyglutamate synthase
VRDDPLDYLFSLEQFGVKFGLDNIRTIVDALGHPERSFPSVHVAGTNGKGSVAAMVESVLREAGLHTGRYTSPHLVSLTERMAIDGAPIPLDTLRDVVDAVRQQVRSLLAGNRLETHPTFFEVTTAAAFLAFERARVDMAVCEVGLGGRLDATNVLQPQVCAITSIARDHERYLGSSLQEIAAEKAGIIKPDTPVVTGDLPDVALEVITRTARNAGAPLIRAREGSDASIVGSPAASPLVMTLETPARDYGEIALGLAGSHQAANALVAVRILEALEAEGTLVGREAIVRGLRNVRWPGRLEHIELDAGRDALLDAAHNPAGAAALAAYLESEQRGRTLVFAAMQDKDIEGILRALMPSVAHVVVTRASHPRSAPPDAIAELVRRLAPALTVSTAENAADALAAAWSTNSSIVVAGSIFLLGDVVNELRRS